MTLYIILCVPKRLLVEFQGPPLYLPSMRLGDTVASWTILASRARPCLVNSDRADHHDVDVAATGCKRARREKDDVGHTYTTIENKMNIPGTQDPPWCQLKKKCQCIWPVGLFV
jgi:hypothetical protein